jgi:hypothetical protein
MDGPKNRSGLCGKEKNHFHLMRIETRLIYTNITADEHEVDIG